jgi:predicted nucleotidyltransferase
MKRYTKSDIISVSFFIKIYLEVMKLNLDNDIIDKIIEICKKYNHIEKVVLFGSRARKDNELKSDIDLAVYSNFEIHDFIEDIELNTKTLLEYDFTHINKINDEFFLEQVKKDGIIIYDKFRI